MDPNSSTSYPGVQLVRSGGRLRAYHRKTRTRLPGEIGSSEFLAAVEALNKAGRVSDKPVRGTLALLFESYRASPEFRNLAIRTRADYEKVFLFLQPAAEKKLLLNFKVKDALEIRNVAETKHKRHFANYCISVLRLTLNWGTLYGLVDINPLADKRLKIKRPHGTPKANRRWAAFECDAVLEAATGGVKTAIALGMFCGMREGDVLRVSRLNYDGARITWVQGKTGEPVRLPVARRLKEILDDALARRQSETRVVRLRPERSEEPPLVVNQSGEPYTPDGFRTMLWRLIQKLEVAGEVMPGLTFHGLRHTAATALADLGASPHEIAAMLGQRTLVMATHYSSEANREKLGEAAIIRLNPRIKE